MSSSKVTAEWTQTGLLLECTLSGKFPRLFGKMFLKRKRGAGPSEFSENGYLHIDALGPVMIKFIEAQQ